MLEGTSHIGGYISSLQCIVDSLEKFMLQYSFGCNCRALMWTSLYAALALRSLLPTHEPTLTSFVCYRSTFQAPREHQGGGGEGGYGEWCAHSHCPQDPTA